jgi:BED zinc finger
MAASGLLKFLSGRKRESTVWQHFEFVPDTGKSVCKVLSENRVKCGALINGKNTTNLKVHLSNHHKALYRQLLENDEVIKKNRLHKYREAGMC